MFSSISSFIPYFYPIVDKTFSNPLGDINTLDDLLDHLDTCDIDQWIEWKDEIKEFLMNETHKDEELDTFFKTITKSGLEKNPQQIMTLLTYIASVDLLTDAITFKEKDSDILFEDIFEYAKEHAFLYPKPLNPSLTEHVYSEWKRYRPIVLYFIPNLMNIFLGAFNFIDSHKKFTTLWEKHLLLEIIYKFFIIPYCLVQILQPVFVVTAKVYCIAACIIVAVGILITSYQRWFRPVPDEIVNCVNLDRKMERGLIQPKVGQVKEIALLTEALEMNKNVLIIGPSGEGKTALVHHLVQLKAEEKLSDELQALTVHEVNSGMMTSNLTYGYAELIEQMREDIDGFEDNFILFFDEFYQVIAADGAFCHFKQQFLEDTPHARFIATLSSKQFEELKKKDTDGSFLRRVECIEIKSDEEQERHILRENIERVAGDILVTEDAIDEILSILDKEKKDPDSPEIGRPAKAINLLTRAIGLCRAAHHPSYVPLNLSEKRQEYEILKLQAVHDIKAQPKTLKKIREVKDEIDELEKNLKIQQSQIQEVKTLLGDQKKMKDEYYTLTHLIAEEKEPTQKEQILYLWYHFYAIDAIKEILQEKIEEVQTDIPIQVDKDLIGLLYKELEKESKVENEEELEEGSKVESEEELEEDETEN